MLAWFNKTPQAALRPLAEVERHYPSETEFLYYRDDFGRRVPAADRAGRVSWFAVAGGATLVVVSLSWIATATLPVRSSTADTRDRAIPSVITASSSATGAMGTVTRATEPVSQTPPIVSQSAGSALAAAVSPPGRQHEAERPAAGLRTHDVKRPADPVAAATPASGIGSGGQVRIINEPMGDQAQQAPVTDVVWPATPLVLPARAPQIRQVALQPDIALAQQAGDVGLIVPPGAADTSGAAASGPSTSVTADRDVRTAALTPEPGVEPSVLASTGNAPAAPFPSVGVLSAGARRLAPIVATTSQVLCVAGCPTTRSAGAGASAGVGRGAVVVYTGRIVALAGPTSQPAKVAAASGRVTGTMSDARPSGGGAAGTRAGLAITCVAGCGTRAKTYPIAIRSVVPPGTVDTNRDKPVHGIVIRRGMKRQVR